MSLWRKKCCESNGHHRFSSRTQNHAATVTLLRQKLLCIGIDQAAPVVILILEQGFEEPLLFHPNPLLTSEENQSMPRWEGMVERLEGQQLWQQCTVNLPDGPRVFKCLYSCTARPTVDPPGTPTNTFITFANHVTEKLYLRNGEINYYAFL